MILFLLMTQLVAAATPTSDHAVQQARDYLQRMRETTDYSYAARAQKLIDSAPKSYAAQQVQVELHLFRHEFPQVIALSRKLAESNPKDPVNHATLGDALMETGQYDAAADAYQQMVDLQAGLMAYNRIGWWRYVNGDTEGAIEMMQRAVRSGRPNHEHTAWCLVELGNLYLRSGRRQQAEAAYRAALQVFPRMHTAYAGLGQALAASGQVKEAIESLKKAQAMAPMVEYAGLLADLYVVAQQPAEVETQLAMVDLQARMEAASGQKANRQIALIYANHQRKLTEALEVAEADLAHRKDVFTWDAYSWVLYRMGRSEEAAKASRQALRAGTQDALLLYHAGVIAHAQGDKTRARDLLQQALHLNPNFAPREAPQAIALLKELVHDATE